MKHLESLLLLPLLYGPAALAQKQPNILWITIEDTSPQFIGCYGNDYAVTPVIDQLAREGVRFTNAFSTGTVCSPSRSCIITGVKTYKTGTGNHRSSYPIPGFIKGFPYFMQKGGYYTSNNSKTDYNIANAGDFTKEAWNESSGKAGWTGIIYGIARSFFSLLIMAKEFPGEKPTASTWVTGYRLLSGFLKCTRTYRPGELVAW